MTDEEREMMRIEAELREHRNFIYYYKQIDWIDFVETEFEGFTYLLPSNNPKSFSSYGFQFSLFGQTCQITQKNYANHIIGYAYGQSIKEDLVKIDCPSQAYGKDSDCNDVTILCYKRGEAEPIFAKCFHMTGMMDYQLGRLYLPAIFMLKQEGDGEYFLVVHNHVYEHKNGSEIETKTVNGCQVSKLFIHPCEYDPIEQESECELSAREPKAYIAEECFMFDFKFSAVMPFDTQIVRVICLDDRYDVIGTTDKIVVENKSKNEKACYDMPLYINKAYLSDKTQCHIVVAVNNLPILDYDVELGPSTTKETGKSNPPRHNKAPFAAKFYLNNPIFEELNLSAASALPELYSKLKFYCHDPENFTYNINGLHRYIYTDEDLDFLEDLNSGSSDV